MRINFTKILMALFAVSIVACSNSNNTSPTSGYKSTSMKATNIQGNPNVDTLNENQKYDRYSFSSRYGYAVKEKNLDGNQKIFLHFGDGTKDDCSTPEHSPVSLIIEIKGPQGTGDVTSHSEASLASVSQINIGGARVGIMPLVEESVHIFSMDENHIEGQLLLKDSPYFVEDGIQGKIQGQFNIPFCVEK